MRCRLAMLVRLGTLRLRRNTHYFAKYLSSFYRTSIENDGAKLRWDAGDLTVTGLQARPAPTPLHQTPVNSKRGTRGAGGRASRYRSVVRSIPRLEFFQQKGLTTSALRWAPLDWELYLERATAEVELKQKKKAVDDFRWPKEMPGSRPIQFWP
jgi:hypothetical protein